MAEKVLTPTTIKDNPFPELKVANEVTSPSFNSIKKNISGSFRFSESGALRISQKGYAGYVLLSPAGLEGYAGSTRTFYIDAQTGSAYFSGAITASTIDIGGADATSFHVDINGNIWSGGATFATALFKVSNAGALTATGVDVTGKVTATSGTIGGWALTPTTLSGTNVLLDSGGMILCGTASDNISMLISSTPVISFMIGSAVKGLLRATTAGSGGIAVVGGDLVIDNDKSVLIKGSSDYGGITVNGNDLWLFTTASDKFYLKDHNYADLINIGSSGMITCKSNQIKLGDYTLTLNADWP